MDGKTYKNKEELLCNSMSLHYLGECEKDERTCFEKCPTNYEPVCT